MIYDSFAPTEQPELQQILSIMNIQPNQTFCDLGSGEGDVVIAAAQLGAIATGMEIDDHYYNLSLQKINDQSIQNASIVKQNFYTQDFNGYDILYTNLSEDVIRKIWDKLLTCHANGSKIYMYMGIEGYRRCFNCDSVLYEETHPNVRVVKFDLSNTPWFLGKTGYSHIPETSRLYTHVLMIMD